ncbi:hypothetical protein CALVIDRAFT_599972 [Calocera viscosa TUFC12733]|uniref:Spindle pole body component n=1 Tax=Calocera viscosa (strain TUFC12733) TaxID=1330018 RepID=A0A167K641_CALVF|nr:hypothetical protein CALVIDRAFT_599972 [Calocera viscosa TUFC12733]
MAGLADHLDDTSLRPLDLLLPDWLPSSAELPRDPEDAFAKSLALALSPPPGSRLRQEALEPEGPRERGVIEEVELEEFEEENHLWELAAKAVTVQPTLLTWDTSPQVFRLPPLLSHHPELFYAALRKTVDTPKVIPLNASYVASELRTVLVGYSGSLWIWDAEREEFNPGENAPEAIIVDGYTAAACSSIFERFLTIGTLLRRLQAVPDQLRGYLHILRLHTVIDHQDRASESWMHAFSHALTLVLSHIRDTLEKEPACPSWNLSSLHLEYESQEALLTALADLLRRDRRHIPPYRSFPSNMISALYKALDRATASSSPHVLQCTIAFLLQLSTQPCVKAVEDSLGLGQATFLAGFVDDLADVANVTDDPVPKEVKAFEMILPTDVRQTLERGRKSLALLKKACPSHILCGRSAEDIDNAEHLRWIWSDAEVQSIQIQAERQADLLRTLVERWKLGLATHQVSKDVPFPRLADAANPFDTSVVPLPPAGSSNDNAFTEFLQSHPAPLLPSFAPTLPLLLHHVFAKILARSKVISHALLETLLSPPSQEGGADLLAYIHILKSFHLLSFTPFTELLANALFVHPSPEIAHAPGTRSRVRARLGIASLPHQVTGEEFAAVGLGVGLTQRGQWPPGGSDLNWILRRVVIDALAADMQGRAESTHIDKVWEEADSIVGFGIRDIEEGDDAWLDPLAVEALDFLDLQYKVPRSLAVILSDNVVSKYRGIFSFLLRVLRVDTVVRTIFHPSFHESLFPASAQHTRLLYRTRFLAQSFITSLVDYLFDTAIRSPWDAFHARLTHVRESNAHDTELQDVFAVAAYHDAVMDSILEGCMLRSHQTKLAGELKTSLGTVLLLGQLVLDRRRGTVSEGEGGKKLEALADRFSTSVQKLIDFLKHYHGREVERSRVGAKRETGPRGANLADLLLRLNFHEPPKRME